MKSKSNHKELQIANEYAAESRIYKDLIIKITSRQLDSANRMPQCRSYYVRINFSRDQHSHYTIPLCFGFFRYRVDVLQS